MVWAPFFVGSYFGTDVRNSEEFIVQWGLSRFIGLVLYFFIFGMIVFRYKNHIQQTLSKISVTQILLSQMQCRVQMDLNHKFEAA